MNKILIVLFLLATIHCTSQTFAGTTGPINNGGSPASSFSVSVNGINNLLDTVFGLEEVCINITHPAVEELHVFLRSPNGIEVELTGTKSCKGSGFTNTCFNNKQATSVTTASAPYTGTFRPVGNLGRFNRQQQGNGTWRLIVDDFTGGANTGTLLSWSLNFTSSPAHPVILSSSNFPLVFINTSANQPLTEGDSIITLGIIDNGAARNFFNDPKNNYSGKATCHIRGASSKMFEKKNLKLELKDSTGTVDRVASLLGMPADSDWILTACYTDKTMIRNPLSQTLFQNMGHYSPRYRYVELILNNEYYGVYILMEQIKRGSQRVNINAINSTDSLFPEVTGGYIIQINRANDPGWYSLNQGVSANGAHFYYQYDYPRAGMITQPQKNYIKSVLDSFETVMATPSFTDPAQGYRKFIDDNSFIDYLILNELSKNVDAYKLSSYFYKDNFVDGGKIHMGPVWDYDLAWHNCNFGNGFSELLWQFDHNNSSNPIPTWWQRLVTDQHFKDKLYCRYHTLRQDLLSNKTLYKYIDEQAALVDEAQQRNYRQFPILGAYIYANPQIQPGSTYQTEIADLKTWIDKRSAWLDVNIPGFCNNVSLNENLSSEQLLSVYPNPFETSVNIILKKEMISEPVTILILDAMGKKVFEQTKMMTDKNGKLTLHLDDLAPGAYILNIKSGNEFYYYKMIRSTTY